MQKINILVLSYTSTKSATSLSFNILIQTSWFQLLLSLLDFDALLVIHGLKRNPRHLLPSCLQPYQVTYGRTRKGNLHPISPTIFGRGSTPLPISILQSLSRSSKIKFLTSTVKIACKKKHRKWWATTHTAPTHLEFCHRKILPQTRPRSIREREQVSVSLDFFRLGRYTVLAMRVLEPSGWPEHFRVRTPHRGGAVHGFHRDSHQGVFRDCQAVDQFAGFRADRFRERDHIIFNSLYRYHIHRESSTRKVGRVRLVRTYDACNLDDRRVDAKDLMDNRVEVGKTICKLIVRWVDPMLEKLISQLRLYIRVP